MHPCLLKWFILKKVSDPKPLNSHISNFSGKVVLNLKSRTFLQNPPTTTKRTMKTVHMTFALYYRSYEAI